MGPQSNVLFRKLCYLLHRGLVESRKLSQQGKSEQVFDLADAFEQVPGLITDWQEEHLGLIRSNLRTYQGKYGPLAFDYLGILEMDDEHFMEVFARW
jgi:hypothetical protein